MQCDYFGRSNFTLADYQDKLDSETRRVSIIFAGKVRDFLFAFLFAFYNGNSLLLQRK